MAQWGGHECGRGNEKKRARKTIFNSPGSLFVSLLKMRTAFLLAASLALARAGDLPPAVAGYFDTQNNMDCISYVNLFAADFTIQGTGVTSRAQM